MDFLVQGKMKGAHGQPNACFFGVNDEGMVFFFDTARAIYGGIDADPIIVNDFSTDPQGLLAAARDMVFRHYHRGYEYYCDCRGNKLTGEQPTLTAK